MSITSSWNHHLTVRLFTFVAVVSHTNPTIHTFRWKVWIKSQHSVWKTTRSAFRVDVVSAGASAGVLQKGNYSFWEVHKHLKYNNRTSNSIFPSIHLLHCLSFWVAGVLKPIPVLRQRAGNTLDMLPVHHRADTQVVTPRGGNLASLNYLSVCV